MSNTADLWNKSEDEDKEEPDLAFILKIVPKKYKPIVFRYPDDDITPVEPLTGEILKDIIYNKGNHEDYILRDATVSGT
jgi:hypothetical protein